MLIPVGLVRMARWALTHGQAIPEQRLAIVDAIDIALAKHEATREHP